MKIQQIALSALSIFVLATAAWALPRASGKSAAPKPAVSGQEQAQTQTQSVSGKITSVDKSSFSLSVTSSRQEQKLQSQDAAKTMTFQIDSNTTVDGKLEVGASADVTYREEAGNNVAISVRVTPAA